MKRKSILMFIRSLVFVVGYQAAFAQQAPTLPGKFYFSNTPFTNSNVGGKPKFKSNEFIYGRLEVSEPVEKSFKMPKKSSKYVTHVEYVIDIFKGDQQIGISSWPYTMVSEGERGQTYLNFDVLPKPSEATTQTCGTEDFSTNIASAPLYSMVARKLFTEGEYTIKVYISHPLTDPYTGQPDYNSMAKWPKCVGEFKFEFSSDDIPALLENGEKANDLAKENANKKTLEARGLPEQWNWKSAPIVIDNLTEKQLTDMYVANEASGLKCIKAVIFPNTGTRWMVDKNDLGVPTRQWHSQTIGFFSKQDGHYYWDRAGARKDYQGGGNYGKIYMQRVERVEINGKDVEEALKTNK